MARGIDDMEKVAEKVAEGIIAVGTAIGGALVGRIINNKKNESKLKHKKNERSELSDNILKKVANKKKIISLDKEISDLESKIKR